MTRTIMLRTFVIINLIIKSIADLNSVILENESLDKINDENCKRVYFHDFIRQSYLLQCPWSENGTSFSSNTSSLASDNIKDDSRDNERYNNNTGGSNQTISDKENQTKSIGDQQSQQEAEPPLPSFNEWTKQKLEEQQHTRHVGDGNGGGNANGATVAIATDSGSGSTSNDAASTQIPSTDHHQHARNYASKECGAKILLANPQAKHSSSVLNEKDQDEYMLNPCNVEQKFFVVELCETIQITRLDLANFELFSSSPKEFRVFVSERYPPNEWTFLGAWTAEDQRKIQNFAVDRRVYAKYVKVELLSHYGTEHFCPMSLIRVLGVSVVEEYEAEAAQEHHHQAHVPAELPSDPVQSLPSPPGPTDDRESKEPVGSPVDDDDMTPPTQPSSHLDESSENLIRPELLSTAKDVVVTLAKGVINKAQAVFTGQKVIENGTNSVASERLEWRPCLTCDLSTNTNSRLCGYIRAFMLKGHVQKFHQIAMNISKSPITSTNSSKFTLNSVGSTKTDGIVSKKFNELISGTIRKPILDIDQNSTNGVQKMPIYSTPTQDASSLPGVATTAKETVFARLNNRIRALETNMSLSGEYLGQLSLRYRKEMDEMQRQSNRSNSILNEYKMTVEEKLGIFRMEIDRLKWKLEKMKLKLTLGINGGNEQMEMDNEENESSQGQMEMWILPLLIGVQFILTVVSAIIGYSWWRKCRVLEKDVDKLVEKRVRRIMAEELMKWKKNNASISNGHLPSEIDTESVSISTYQADCESNHSPSAVLNSASTQGLIESSQQSGKSKKKSRKRHQKNEQSKINAATG